MAGLRATAFVAVAGASVSCWSLTTDVPSVSGGSASSSASSASSSSGFVPDGGPNAVDAEAGAGGCGATLCDDFDEPGLGAKWSAGALRGNGGFLAHEPAAGRSAPNVLLARVTSPCTDGFAQLVDEKSFPPQSMVIAADALVAKAPGTGGVHLFGTRLVTEKGHYRVDLAFAGDRLVLAENDGGTYKPRSSPVTFPKGVFARVELSITFTGTPRAVLKVDGTTQLDFPITVPAVTQQLSRFELGAYVASCEGDVELRFDDLVYTVLPR